MRPLGVIPNNNSDTLAHSPATGKPCIPGAMYTHIDNRKLHTRRKSAIHRTSRVAERHCTQPRTRRLICLLVSYSRFSDLVSVRLALYLLGKLFISMVFTSVYLFTSELYPTRYRHTFIGFSSMIGRIGNITAPLTPALVSIHRLHLLFR